MREIIFRAKPVKKEPERCLNKAGFTVGWYCKAPFGPWPLTDCIYPAQLAEDGEWRPVEIDPATIGQYTGLRDKNGKKVFEGDIVKDRRNYRYAVVFKNEDGAACFGLSFDRLNWTLAQGFVPEEKPEDFEIIGNVYDDPKLLEPQFEGFFDKAGKEIAACDIVRIGEGKLVGHVIQTFEGLAFVSGVCPEQSHLLEHNPEKYEVIGNFMENPELELEADNAHD